MSHIHPLRRSGHGRALSLALLLLASSAQAATLKLASQNCLHLGWGSNTNKEPALKAEFAQYDVILLQEVMASADVSRVLPGAPGTYYVLPGAVPTAAMLKGASSYKQAYVFIVKTGLTAAGTVDYPDTAKDFSRPPTGLLLQTGTNWTWFVDYHAVYGNRKAVRQAEVSAISKVYDWFQAATYSGSTYPRVIIGGDWNLPATDPAYGSLNATGRNIQILPNTPTSLKTNGAPSQAYDHFVWDANQVTVSNCAVIQPSSVNPGLTGKWWRQNVSDHLGITCDVTY